jgi:ADP-ribosylglycohydrolase
MRKREERLAYVLRARYKLFSGLIADDPEDTIRSHGYVIDTLEASVWCLLKTRSFQEAVLKAVNLGHDTDTTGTVTGGLAGIHYGLKAVPDHWLNQLVRVRIFDRFLRVSPQA